MKTIVSLAIAMVLSLCMGIGPLRAVTVIEGLQDYKLENGLKVILLENFPLQMMTQDSFARFIAQVEYYNLGKNSYARYPSYIESVTRQEVQQAAGTYLHPDRYLLSIVADLDKVDLSVCGLQNSQV